MAELGDPKLRLDGMDIRLVLYVSDKPVAASQVQFESGEVAEKSTMHEDKLMGDDLDQHDKRLRGHTIRATFFMADTSIIDAIKTRDQFKLARQPAGTMGVGLLVAQRDGTFAGKVLTEVEASWNWGLPGSDQRLKCSINGMGRELQDVAGL